MQRPFVQLLFSLEAFGRRATIHFSESRATVLLAACGVSGANARQVEKEPYVLPSPAGGVGAHWVEPGYRNLQR